MHPSELLLGCLGDDACSLLGRTVPWPVWEEVAQQAIRHGLAPLLYQRVQQLPRELAPPPGVVDQLRDLYVHNELRNTSLYAELAQVLGALHDAGVEVILLKGAYVAEAVYGDIALRPMHDVDLLVKTSELDRVQSILQALGYGLPENGVPAKHHLAPLTKPGMVPIEVHWTLVRPSSISPDLHHLWETARETEIAGVQVLTLSPEHLLHHLCLHVSYHHRFQVPLLQLHDIAAVVQRYRNLDWNVFEEIVHAVASQKFVYSVLALVQRAFPGSVASERLVHFHGSSVDDVITDTAWECLTDAAPRKFPRFYLQLSELDGNRARMKYLGRRILLLGEHFRFKHGLAQSSLRVYWRCLAHILGFVRRRGRLTAEILLRRATRESLVGASRWASLEHWAESDRDVA